MAYLAELALLELQGVGVVVELGRDALGGETLEWHLLAIGNSQLQCPRGGGVEINIDVLLAQAYGKLALLGMTTDDKLLASLLDSGL